MPRRNFTLSRPRVILLRVKARQDWPEVALLIPCRSRSWWHHCAEWHAPCQLKELFCWCDLVKPDTCFQPTNDLCCQPTPFPQKGYRESQGYQCESDPLIKPFCSPAIGSSFRPILRADARPAPRFQLEKLDIMMERPHRLGSFSINQYIYMYMYICIHIYISIYLSKHIYMSIYKYIQIYIYIFIHIYIYIYMYLGIHDTTECDQLENGQI